MALEIYKAGLVEPRPMFTLSVTTTLVVNIQKNKIERYAHQGVGEW